MSIRQMMVMAALIGLILVVWSTALSAQEAAPGSEAAPVYPGSPEATMEARREAAERRRDDIRDMRTGRHWRQAPWVTAREEAMETQRAQMREQMRARRAAREQWQDARDWWRNPRSQWIEEMQDARRAAMEAQRLRSEEMINRMMLQRPGPGGPWGGPHSYW